MPAAVVMEVLINLRRMSCASFKILYPFQVGTPPDRFSIAETGG